MAEATTVSVLLQAKDQASATIDKVEGRMGRLAGNFGKHRQKIGMAAAGIGAGITAIGVAAMKSFQEEQIGIKKLDAALKGAGSSYDAQKKSIEAVVAAQQNKTNFGDEQQRDALRQLVLASGDYENSIKVLPALLDTAAGSGKSLEGVALAVGRAIGGEATALKGFGVTLDNTAGPLEVITALQQKFGGQAEASADPMTQLTNRLGDLSQEFGKVLLPILESVIPKIELFVRQIIEWTSAHPELTKVLALTAAAIGAILLVVGPILIALPLLAAGFTMVMASIFPITATILAITVAIAATIIIWKKWEDMGLKMKIALGLLMPPLIILIAVIKNWDKIVDTVKKTVSSFIKSILDLAKGFLQGIKAMTSWHPALRGWGAAIDDAIRKIDDMDFTMTKWAASGGAAMGDMSDEMNHTLIPAVEETDRAFATGTGSIAEDIKKLENEIAGATEGVKESVKGWGFEIDKTNGIVEEKAVAMAEAIRNTAEAFQEAGDVIVTESQRKAKAVRDAEAEIQKSLKETTTALELNAEIDAFLSRQKVENMEEEFEGVRRTTDKILEQIERSNRGLDEHGKKWEELPDAIGHALDKIPPLLGDADFAMQQTLDRMGDKLTDNIHSWGDELEGFSAEQNKRIQDEINREKKKREDEEKDAAEAERQRMIEKFKGTPQFASMAEQREKLRSVEHALESQKGALPSMRQAITQAEAGMQEYAGTGYGASQRRQQYWTGSVRPLQDQYQRQTERIRATRYQIEALQSQIAKNVIPLEYRGIAENVLSNEWMRPMQGGGVSGGGLALVGERGPEVVSLPGGARVHPSGSGPGTNNFIFHGAVYGLEDLRRVVVEAVRDHALSGGFRGVFGEA